MINRIRGRGSLVRRLVAEARFRRSERQGRTLVPYRPSTLDEVPAAAWRELHEKCGELALDRLLVTPGTWRANARNGRWAERARVMAFGDRAVGCWTDGEDVGGAQTIANEDILAIDDRIVLLSGRLSFVGRGGSMTVAYNAVARTLVGENIRQLRRERAGPDLPTSPGFVWLGAGDRERPASDLPYKWAYLLRHGDSLSLNPQENVKIAVGDVVETGLSHGPATGIAVLSARELVVAAEPADSLQASRYGVDLTVAPRRYLRDVGWNRGQLQIRLRTNDPQAEAAGEATDDLAIRRPLDKLLFEAMRRSFGNEIAWS